MATVKLRGLSRRQIHAYLIEKGAQKVDERYCFPEYTVTITREETVKIGVIPIVELDIQFEGNEAGVQKAIEAFRKSSLRMGG